jgi:hypothetical protein
VKFVKEQETKMMSILIDGLLVNSVQAIFDPEPHKFTIRLLGTDKEDKPASLDKEYNDEVLKRFYWSQFVELEKQYAAVEYKLIDPQAIQAFGDAIAYVKSVYGKHDKELDSIYQELHLVIVKLGVRILQLMMENKLEGLENGTDKSQS